MDIIRSYQIEVQGRIDDHELNPNSPVQISGVRTLVNSTSLTIQADQSGLIGLLRHLHGRGFVLLSLLREG